MKSTIEMNTFIKIKKIDREEHIPIFQAWGDDKVESGTLNDFNINVVPSTRH